MKRMLDITLALACLTVFALPMLVIALVVKLSSPGPVLYWSNRVGRNNRLFPMPKFRSMRTGTPLLATHLLTDSKKWITPVGRILRKTSLDELPQLWSILIGHMSFVGPRPSLTNQEDLNDARTSLGVHRLMPGLTGWAQINGRDEIEDADKIRFDHEYLQRQSLRFDLYILAVTALKVLRREGVVQADERPAVVPAQRRAA
ncbi:MAG TPA: sugar transferase [Planctomycetaceae bacterium]|nr:sugar transferase [Planctomycetaceae bacterium]